MTKRVLLTGAAGFIGHHVVEHLIATTDWHIVATDGITYAGDPHRLADVAGYSPERVTVLWHDLRAPLVGHPISDRIGDVDYVINMAAESHVDRSITHPVEFFRNNVDVALNVLDWVRQDRPDAKVIQVSTDEVYGPAPAGYSHAEWDVIAPSNPYAGSKAAQEAAAFSFWRTYGMRLAITNTMNNFGERQHPEKFVPMVVRNLLTGDPITLHGRPAGVTITNGTGGGNVTSAIHWVPSSRVWLHARNHADAIRYLLAEVDFPRYGDPGVEKIDGRPVPPRFNVAGEREIGVDGIVAMAADTLGVKANIEWVDYHSSRPGHDLRYSLDGSKLTAAGWKAPVPLDESFERTVRWYVDHRAWLGI
jgi:dTDP-glucose 4,6-dehydratase